ncbi:type II toxin-antitoxin system RelE/ParE family toxin [Sulfuriferula sp.]|uniref:type II toxin-antitoxin system RelE family toxin n=1 Tax=Sulfuriferula sp. TaxID=2025307 RepID=UPI002730DDC6|nr:type II toxin-antitoxin system RelE/ParE family toxin [Sulfuriferula sp.]MDP2025829.1 type II toxin-antitoxin system RelE/ParE family toxin [Sulfuriferula sp.]
MAWTIEYTETARKQLRKFDKQVARQIVDYLDERVAPLTDPRGTGKVLVGALGGLWRYRVGDYRAICELRDSALVVLVLQVGNRREVYR